MESRERVLLSPLSSSLFNHQLKLSLVQVLHVLISPYPHHQLFRSHL